MTNGELLLKMGIGAGIGLLWARGQPAPRVIEEVVGAAVVAPVLIPPLHRPHNKQKQQSAKLPAPIRDVLKESAIQSQTVLRNRASRSRYCGQNDAFLWQASAGAVPVALVGLLIAAGASLPESLPFTSITSNVAVNSGTLPLSHWGKAMHRTWFAGIVALLIASPLPAAAQTQFPSEQQAQQHCPKDTVVLLNLPSGVYHFKGERWYGRTKSGAYVCQREADQAGD